MQFWVGEAEQTHSTQSCEARDKGLAPGSDHNVQRCFPHDFGPEPVRDDQPGIIGQQLQREIGPHGEEQPIAELAVFRPLVVGTKILDARLDFNDPYLTSI